MSHGDGPLPENLGRGPSCTDMQGECSRNAVDVTSEHRHRSRQPLAHTFDRLLSWAARGGVGVSREAHRSALMVARTIRRGGLSVDTPRTGEAVTVRTSTGEIVRGTLIWHGDRTVELTVHTAAGRTAPTMIVIPRDLITAPRALAADTR